MHSVHPGLSLHADLRRVVYALSHALDLVGINDLAHGKRVGIMAAECAKVLGLGEAESAFLFDLGLLHDIGVSSTTTHRHLVTEFDWESSNTHCELGHARLCSFPPLAELALPVLYHHTHWDRLTGLKLAPDIARSANLIFLVDRVDALAAPHYGDGSLLLQTPRIRALIAERATTFFAPELVDGFLAASRSEAFWLTLEPRSVQAYLNDMLERGEPYIATAAELHRLATVFSRIIDAKSPFTAAHSLGVGQLSRFLAERLGVAPGHCEQIEIAGLLHDLGKLRVPDEILDKPAPLDPAERALMNAHSFETYQILRSIPGFEEIATWAAQHHEAPGGTGYPFHLAGEQLALEARILRIADIFQAMTQNRPYRQGLPAEQALDFMWDLVSSKNADAEIVAVIGADLKGAMAVSHPDEAGEIEAAPTLG